MYLPEKFSQCTASAASAMLAAALVPGASSATISVISETRFANSLCHRTHFIGSIIADACARAIRNDQYCTDDLPAIALRLETVLMDARQP